MAGLVGQAINAVGDKVGMTAVSTNVGIVAMIESGLIEIVDGWGLSDTALVVSMCVSVMFIIKLRLDIKKTKLEMKLMKKKDKPEK